MKKVEHAGSIINLNEFGLNHKVEIIDEILPESSNNLLKKFFKELRNEKKKTRNENK